MESPIYFYKNDPSQFPKFIRYGIFNERENTSLSFPFPIGSYHIEAKFVINDVDKNNEIIRFVCSRDLAKVFFDGLYMHYITKNIHLLILNFYYYVDKQKMRYTFDMRRNKYENSIEIEICPSEEELFYDMFFFPECIEDKDLDNYIKNEVRILTFSSSTKQEIFSQYPNQMIEEETLEEKMNYKKYTPVTSYSMNPNDIKVSILSHFPQGYKVSLAYKQYEQPERNEALYVFEKETEYFYLFRYNQYVIYVEKNSF